MGSFKFEDVDKYGSKGGGGFFSLKKDGDVARVRFLYNSIDDVEGFAVHEVEVDGKKRYVNCKRAYNDPLDSCPFCRDRLPQYVKLFIPLYSIDEDKVKVWERGKKFSQKLSSICSRYATNTPLVSHTFEIERHGEPGSTQTTYEIYETGNDDTTLEDLPEFEGVVGGIVLDKSAEEMEHYLKHGSFPSSTIDAPRRREVSRSDALARRTPATSRRTSVDDDHPF